MNRTHRVVWNDSRQAFVVASEKAKTKGKPSSIRKAVAAAVVMALVAMVASPAMAATSCPGAGSSAIFITGAETSACRLASGDALTITNTGSISGTSPAVYVSGDAATSIDNSGTISGTVIGIDIYSTGSVTGAITNNGAISGSNFGIHIVSGSSIGSITNNVGGTIAGSGGISLFTGSSVTGGISNSGAITGGSYGIGLNNSSLTGGIVNNGTISGSRGIYLVSGSSADSITNNAGGIISGNSAGIALDASSIISGSIVNDGTISGGQTGLHISGNSEVTVGITNSGIIEGTRGSTSGTGYGIYLSGGSTVGSITNSGTIQGIGGTSSGSGYGIYVNGGNIGSITNSGTIQGIGGSGGYGIYVNGATIGSIVNDGTISGGRTGLYILGNSMVTGGITNNGTITGGTNAIYITSSSTVGGITNTGTINGAVVLGGTTLNLNGTAGSISGAVTGGVGSVVNVNGTFTTSNTFAVDTFSIASGGLLNMGHGVTTTAGFSNGGTLSVAEAGNVTITGDYTQTASGTYRVGAASNTVYGKLNVTGTATLPAAAKIDVDVNTVNTLATGDTLTGVLTAGTLSASTFAVTDNSALFDFTGAINGNAIDLTIAGASTTGVVSAVTATGSTSALGAAAVFDALIAAPAGGDMGSVITALGALSTQQAVSDAVTQTLPLMTGGMTQFTFANLRSMNRVMQARQEGNRGLSSGDDFVGDREAWIKPLASWADQKNRNGAFGYDAQTYGVALGADGELSKISRIGAAFAYTRSKLDSNSGAQTAGVDSYLAVLYGSRSLDENTELNWQADYGYNQNKGNRHMTFVNRTARSNYTSDSLHLGAGIGRTIPMSAKTSFTPSFRADYTTIKENGYTETGADALNLVVNGKTTDELILAVDGKVAYAVSDTSTLTANLGIGYDTQAEQSSITSSFAGGGAAFTTNGINPSATVVRGGLGMVINSSDAMKFTARYDIETRSGYTGQTFSVKLKKPF